MSLVKKISAPIAALICINSMIGSGLFLNPTPLTQIAGALGFLGYLFSSIIFVPIILSVATLAKLHPVAGGLYVYARTYIGQGAGFLSGWSYFIGKTTTVVFIMHNIVIFFQSCSPQLANLPTLTIDYTLIFLFIIINILGVQVGGKIQYFFSVLKATPILFTFIFGALTFDASFYTANAHNITNSLLAVSTAAFALLSFEIICSIGHLIENPEKNIKFVIISAFLIVTSINIIFQLILYGAMGQELVNLKAPVLALGLKALPHLPWLANIINGSVFAALTAGFFSILTSNSWNLHTLAANNHLPFAGYLTRLNSRNIPWISLIAEGLLGCLIITISSNQLALVNMSVFAQTIALLLSVIAAYLATINNVKANLASTIPLIGMLSCGFVLILSFLRILQSGVSFPFLSVFLIGGIAAIVKHLQQ